jgi:hypothetical protein
MRIPSTTMGTHGLRRRLVLPLIALTALALSGCSSWTDGQSVASPTRSPLPTGTGVTVADLGPVPEAAVFTPEEEEAARAAAVEKSWDNFSAVYPDAIRPEATFVEYVTGAAYMQRYDCLVAEGVDLNLSPDGRTWERANTSASTQFDDLADFVCATRYPGHPQPPATVEQLGYLYDYLVQIQVPCLATFGLATEAPPTREEFITEYPDQGWFASPLDDTSGINEETLYSTCPSTPAGL